MKIRGNGYLDMNAKIWNMKLHCENETVNKQIPRSLKKFTSQWKEGRCEGFILKNNSIDRAMLKPLIKWNYTPTFRKIMRNIIKLSYKKWSFDRE